MAGPARLAKSARMLAVAAALAALVLGLAPSAVSAAWDGGMDLYRPGVFSTQKTWRWCTAADVQIMRNIVLDRENHSRDAQQRYYRYMRNHNRYDIPPADGVDPGGWAAGLRHFVDDRYRRVASSSFSAALRSAVTSLRETRLPVGITVSHGNHALGADRVHRDRRSRQDPRTSRSRACGSSDRCGACRAARMATTCIPTRS